MTRPIDVAMVADRPDKAFLRGRWIDLVVGSEGGSDDRPLYVTMCGAEGHEIRMLQEAGVLETSENGAISDSSQVVAVEANAQAVLALQRQYPGLRILEEDFSSILSGPGIEAWPRKKEWKAVCAADIINLDFQGPLTAGLGDSDLIFRDLQLVFKLLHFHRVAGVESWRLFLTFCARITWDDATCEAVARYLRDNFEFSEAFKEACRLSCGEAVVDVVESGSSVAISELGEEDVQRLLMMVVPKKISRLAVEDGWSVRTEWNSRYGHGASGDRMPMVSWGFEFRRDQAASTEPHRAYATALNGVFEQVEELLDTGEVVAG